MLTRIGVNARAWAARQTPWTPTTGVVRSALAACTLSTLLVNHSDVLFVTTAEHGVPLVCDGSRAIGLYCILTLERLELARWLSIGALLLIASGWRPRITGILHWYVTFSFQANATVLDGGDQIAALLCLLLLPFTLTDPRTWHWQNEHARTSHAVACVIAGSSLTAARVQVAVIYFLAAVGKLQVPEWINGTVLYYWFMDPTIGAAPWLEPALRWLCDHGAVLAPLTWGVLLLEFGLAGVIFMDRRYRPWFFAGGILLHTGVLLIHGIASLSVTMMAALVLYVNLDWSSFELVSARRFLAVGVAVERSRTATQARL
jgi:antimicrobial peptide system SdpB family protein